jgi:hypothetical protein
MNWAFRLEKAAKDRSRLASAKEWEATHWPAEESFKTLFDVILCAEREHACHCPSSTRLLADRCKRKSDGSATA